MPLSSYGLCDAEITAPAAACSSRVSTATPGVGSTPSNNTSQPAEVMPAANAASSISPEIRVSLPISTSGRAAACRAANTAAAARPTAYASSGVRSSLARPRTPSVPKYFPIPLSSVSYDFDRPQNQPARLHGSRYVISILIPQSPGCARGRISPARPARRAYHPPHC